MINNKKIKEAKDFIVKENPSNWRDLRQALLDLPNDKNNSIAGHVFESIAKAYFETRGFKNVWAFDEIPLRISKKAGFDGVDRGVDIVLEDLKGNLSAVQIQKESK